jgi:hypothetical protein
MKPTIGRMMVAAASVAVREAAHRCMRWLQADRTGSAVLLREGDTRLAVVRDGRLLVESADITLSHAEFVRRALGTLPQGAWDDFMEVLSGIRSGARPSLADLREPLSRFRAALA